MTKAKAVQQLPNGDDELIRRAMAAYLRHGKQIPIPSADSSGFCCLSDHSPNTSNGFILIGDRHQTHLISSLIASWRSNAEQTHAQSGSEAN